MFHTGALRQNFLHDGAIHIGEPEVAAEVASSETGMIETEQMQHGRVQIVKMHFAVDDLVAHRISLAIRQPRFNAASSHPCAETLRLMLATVFVNRSCSAQILTPWRATEFAGP